MSKLLKNVCDLDAFRQRISAHADPVGALIDVANGLPLRFIEIDADGNEIERFEHVSVSQRLTVLRDLKDAVLPKLSRNDPQFSEPSESLEFLELVDKRAREHAAKDA